MVEKLSIYPVDLTAHAWIVKILGNEYQVVAIEPDNVKRGWVTVDPFGAEISTSSTFEGALRQIYNVETEES
jgi:hypothetical protein